MRLFLSWLLALLALATAPALAAPTYPARPEGAVLDQAGILPPAEEAALDAKLRAYNQSTGRALVVATVSSLEDETIEMYAVRLFEAWGIGGKESDSGLLLLVAPTERKVRIEVGYGLHGYVTDALSGRIIRGEIAPKFKAGNMPGGIAAGIDALIVQLDRTPADARAVAEAAAAAQAQAGQGSGGSGGSLFFWLILMVFIWSLFGRRGRKGSRRSGIDPGIVLWGASEIARHMTSSGGGGFSSSSDSGSDFGGFGGGESGGGGASGDW